ncbi:MAG TPA: YdeI/OmpD-associated family protein [Patescibacteria group bacterium]
METFSSEIEIIGVNPFVFIPKNILAKFFGEVGRSKGPIPIKGTINGKNFVQTLVKYQGEWRLYVNGIMLKSTGLKVGERAEFNLQLDKSSREIPMHPEFLKLLSQNKKAKDAFEKYPPSRQKEINRYLNNIKSDSIRLKNIDKIIRHLKGEKVEYFVLLRNKS